ncbi:MAG: glycine oxidase ThiO [Archangium sp.]
MKIVVVGGGIMGLSIALELRKRPADFEVTVLEKSIPGAEASSAAAGMLAPQFESDGPGPMLELALLSRMAWPKFVADLQEKSGVDCAYVASGGLQIAFTEDELQALDATHAWQSAQGLRGELLDASQLQKLEPSINPRALGALHLPDDHQVDPRKLLPALAVAATKSGVQFKTGTVRSISAGAVDLDGELLKADKIVLAAGAWSGLVTGADVDPSRVRPMRGQLVELHTRAPIVTHLLKSANGYVVPRTDGRVIAGSTMEMVGFDKNVTVAGVKKVLDAAVELVPDLARAALVQSWAGLRPWTDDQLPFIGEGPSAGLLLATGHFRNGILLAPITARLVGQLVRGERTTVDLKPFRYHRGRA